MATCCDEKLAVKSGGLELKNPVVVASAGYTVDAWSLKRMIRTGAGAVVTKSTTYHPQGGWPRKWEWSPRPRNFWNLADGAPLTAYFPEDPGYMSGMDGTEALLNPGYKRMCRFIRESASTAKEEGCHIVGSLSPRSIEEGVSMAQAFEKAGASAIHMDLGCPSAAKFRTKQLPGLGYDTLGCWWCEEIERTLSLVKEVKESVDVPVWPKITLMKWFKETPRLIQELDKTKPDAYPYDVSVSPQPMWIDVYRGKPISPRPNMPIPVVVPLTVGVTAQVAKFSSTELMPSGGVSTATDVIQLLMAGATSVGICRAFYKDINLCKKICEGLEYYIASQALNSINDIKGAALKFIDYPAKPTLAEEYEREAFPIEVPAIEDDRSAPF